MTLAKATGRFTETTIDDEVVVMSLASGDFFSLTGSARAIWDMLDAHHDRAGLIGALAKEYGAEPAAIVAIPRTDHRRGTRGDAADRPQAAAGASCGP